VDVYLGLEEAMEKAGERVRALQSFPELSSATAVLIFRLVLGVVKNRMRRSAAAVAPPPTFDFLKRGALS
jgi:hypothetical protein